MKKLLRTTLAIVAILMLCTAPCLAARGWHGGGYGWRGGWGWGWGPILGAEVLGLGLMEMSISICLSVCLPLSRTRYSATCN